VSAQQFGSESIKKFVLFPAAFAHTLQLIPLSSLHNLSVFILCLADTVTKVEKGHTAESKEASVGLGPAIFVMSQKICTISSLASCSK